MRITHLAAALTAAGVTVLAGATSVFVAGPSLAGSTVTAAGASDGPSDEPSTSPSEEPSGEPSTSPSEEPTPDFNADITPHVFSPGDRLTVTTTGCPTLPTVTDVDGIFTSALVLKETGPQAASGSAVTKTNLSPTKTYHVIVTCKDVGSFIFSASPGKKTTKHHTGQTGVVPVGGVQTGDGSSLGGGNGMIVSITTGASALVMATALTVAYRRRKAQEDA